MLNVSRYYIGNCSCVMLFRGHFLTELTKGEFKIAQFLKTHENDLQLVVLYRK